MAKDRPWPFDQTVKEAIRILQLRASIVYPPPDVRAIVDKTATFVARNGRVFEARIAKNEKNNLKFGFLRSDDPYHAYYEFKIKSILDESANPKPKGKTASFFPPPPDIRSNFAQTAVIYLIRPIPLPLSGTKLTIPKNLNPSEKVTTDEVARPHWPKQKFVQSTKRIFLPWTLFQRGRAF